MTSSTSLYSPFSRAIINSAISVANRYRVMARRVTGRLRRGQDTRRIKKGDEGKKRTPSGGQGEKAKRPHSSREKKIYHRGPPARLRSAS